MGDDTGAARRDKLRDAAEALADLKTEPHGGGASYEHTLHELRVHQIELEMQNEELRRLHVEAELARDRYLDLYDFAPVAYLSLNDKGQIVQANLTAATLLGEERKALLTRRFAGFIAAEDCDRWHLLFGALQRHGGRQRIELVLRRRDAALVHVQLDCVSVNAGPGAHDGRVYRLSAVEDVTERTRANEKLRAYAAQITALTARLLTAQEEERRRIARELHDEMGQALTSALLALGSVAMVASSDADRRSLAAARALVQQAIEQVRSAWTELRPSTMDGMSLADALRSLLDQHAQCTRMSVQLHADATQAPILPALGDMLYRVAQEALTNVARHAQASVVTLELTHRDGEVVMRVHDNGKGFDAAAVLHGRHMGIVGMRERMRLLAGTLTVESIAGQGTTVCATAPAVLPAD